jgi:hypothetical protein
MVTRTQIDRLSSRIEALTARAKSKVDDPREELLRRLRVMDDRMRAALVDMGEPLPPPPSQEERDDIFRRIREHVHSRRGNHGD